MQLFVDIVRIHLAYPWQALLTESSQSAEGLQVECPPDWPILVLQAGSEPLQQPSADLIASLADPTIEASHALKESVEVIFISTFVTSEQIEPQAAFPE